MSSIEVPLKKTCLALCALSGCVLFADVPAPRGPVYYLPLDGDARWGGAAPAKPAVVHGASKYVDGVIGRGLDVKRHAYDQVTALVADALPEFPLAEGTFAFWFKPHWKETDGQPHRIFSIGTKDWKVPFRFYAVKGRSQSLDISFCAPKQMQILKRNIFLPETWVHLAFAWSAAAKQYVFFVNGKECDRRMNPSAFSLTAASVPVKFALGEGTDRFKAVVGDGVYDEIRVYDRALSAAELAMLVTGGETVKMSPVALPRGSAFGFAFAEDRLSATQPLMRLKGRDGAKLLVAATGSSGRLSFLAECGGESAIVESADTLRLKTGYVLAFEERDGALAVLLDGAEQGRFPFRRRFGPIVSAEAADGVTVSEPQERTVRVFPAERSARDVETFSLKGAATRQEGVRSAVSLNAFWRVQPANDYLGAPASGGWEYVRVPGSFRSPLWAFRDRAEPPSWHNRAAWYARTLDVPPEKGPGRTWLVFDNFNADTGRIWFNGRQVHAFRQDFKFFTVVPNRVRVDVTDCLSADGTNEIVLYADRHFVGLWRGVPAIGDHGEIALGDVWLERTPQPATVRTAVAFPDWRGKSVLLRARLDNPGAAIAGAKVVFAFRRPEGAKTFAREVQVGAGAKGQLVEWREPWPEPVEWTAERPELYEMSVSLESAAGTLDTLPAQGFGFREMRVENGRLTLNGKPLRLRMWTSPGLDRLLYYYGTPETVDQFVAHVKWLNYDTVRCNPWGKRSAVSRREYLDACDRQGVYNLYGMPAYEDEPKAGYREAVERFLECYGNHPSILMWYTDFNTCGYAWDQDPAKLTDYGYVPEGNRVARQRAAFAEATMRALDPSRELFQHAGGNMGKIFTSMNYQSYGTPLQEQEDWPAQWAARRAHPLMVVESAFPYPGQFWHFDDPKGVGSLGAEQAARYFGPSAYAAERFPVHHSDEWVVNPAIGEDPNMARLSALHHRRVVKAWRAYGLDGFGNFPGGRDQHHTAETYDRHRVVWRTGGDPKTVGLKPERPDGFSEVQQHLLTDYSRPAYLDDVVREVFEPLLVFAAGDPDAFTSKDHSFFSGERFRKSIVVVNDRLEPVELTYAWKTSTQRGAGTIRVGAGGIVREPIALVAPQVATKTDDCLSVTVKRGGEVVRTDRLAYRVFPSRRPRAVDGIALYDPVGKTERLFKSAGYAYRKVSSPTNLPSNTRLLVLGQSAAFPNLPHLSNLPNILFFEQPTNALARFMMAAPSYRDAFVRDASSPYLAGLDDEDLHDWRGASDTVPAFVTSAEHTPHYPRSKWKCGNGGIVSGCVIRKPSRGNFRTVVESGFDLQYASLLEERRGSARTVWCQLDVTSRFGVDPAATRLVDNLIVALSKAPVPFAPARVACVGDAKPLAAFGVKPGPRGNGAVVLMMPDACHGPRRLQFRAEPPVPTVSPSDTYYRTAQELPEPLFSVEAKGGETVVRLAVAPGDVKGPWAEEKVARVWSGVFEALGIEQDVESAYYGKVNGYDGDAFHNW